MIGVSEKIYKQVDFVCFESKSMSHQLNYFRGSLIFVHFYLYCHYPLSTLTKDFWMSQTNQKQALHCDTSIAQCPVQEVGKILPSQTGLNCLVRSQQNLPWMALVRVMKPHPIVDCSRIKSIYFALWYRLFGNQSIYIWKWCQGCLVLAPYGMASNGCILCQTALHPVIDWSGMKVFILHHEIDYLGIIVIIVIFGSDITIIRWEQKLLKVC